MISLRSKTDFKLINTNNTIRKLQMNLSPRNARLSLSFFRHRPPARRVGRPRLFFFFPHFFHFFGQKKRNHATARFFFGTSSAAFSFLFFEQKKTNMHPLVFKKSVCCASMISAPTYMPVWRVYFRRGWGGKGGQARDTHALNHHASAPST